MHIDVHGGLIYLRYLRYLRCFVEHQTSEIGQLSISNVMT
jgi:hypothetical protein